MNALYSNFDLLFCFFPEKCPSESDTAKKKLDKILKIYQESDASFKMLEETYGISASILCRHMKKKKTPFGPDTILTSFEEQSLVFWISELNAMCFAPTRAQVVAKANEMIEIKDPGRKPLCDQWFTRFKNRHIDFLGLKVAEIKDPNRFVRVENIKEFFVNFTNL